MDFSFLQDHRTALLGVALLLCMWLLLRVNRHEKEKRITRPTPLTPHELGHMVFRAAISNDISIFRQLFLNGGEARSLLGEMAEA